jgi:hypothetical protein
MNRMHQVSVITAVALALAAGVISPAQAAAPANDRVASARAATGVGYTDSVNVSQATSGRSDPRNCSNNASVWYRYRAGRTETINVNTSGSNYDTVIGVYTGGPDALTAAGCVDDNFRAQAALDLQVEAGTTYFFMVAACCGRGGDGQDFGRRLQLQFHMMAPLRVDQLAAADTGTVDRANREAHVVVSRGCGQVADRAFVEARLWQLVGDTFIARGSTFRRVSCGPPAADVTLNFPPNGGIAFGEGSATVTLRMVACWEATGTCTRRRVAEDVVLAFP